MGDYGRWNTADYRYTRPHSPRPVARNPAARPAPTRSTSLILSFLSTAHQTRTLSLYREQKNQNLEMVKQQWPTTTTLHI